MNRHFGKHVIARSLGLADDHPDVEILWLRIYSVCIPQFTDHKEFIESVDAQVLY